MAYRCCAHCAEDFVHDVATDRHEIPCGTPYGVCSTGGDEWVASGDVHEADWD